MSDEKDDYQDFVLKMNQRARAGQYDKPEVLDELRRKAEQGDLRAESSLRMHASLEVTKRLRKD